MATAETRPAISARDLAELTKAVEDMIKGVRDVDSMRRAALELDEGREEIRGRLGELNIAVELTDPGEDE
jgi:hypothetical protein